MSTDVEWKNLDVTNIPQNEQTDAVSPKDQRLENLLLGGGK